MAGQISLETPKTHPKANVYTPLKLTYPLKIDDWMMKYPKYPFKNGPFLGICYLSGGHIDSITTFASL